MKAVMTITTNKIYYQFYGREDHKEEFQHVQYDVCLKLLFVVQAGGLRVRKTLGEPAYRASCRVSSGGESQKCFSATQPPCLYDQVFE
jgi:hypothetical protein